MGAALAAWCQTLDSPRRADSSRDQMRGALLGPRFSPRQIQAFLDANGLPYREMRTEDLQITGFAEARQAGSSTQLL